MAGFLDKLEASEAPTESPGPSFTDKLAAQDQEEGQLRASLGEAGKTTPERAARVKYLSQVTGLPATAVETHEGEAEAMAKFNEIQQQSQTSPVLRQMLMNPDFAKTAQNDTAGLSGIEKVGRTLTGGVRSVAAAATFDISSAAYGLIETGLKVIAPLADPLAGTILPENPLRRVAAGFEGWRKNQAATANAIAGDNSDLGFVPESVIGGFRSFGQNLPALAASVVTGNPAIALTSLTALSGSQSATKGLDAGLTPVQAMAYGLTDATAEFATSILPVTKLLGDIKVGAPLLRMIGNQIIREVPSELAATAWQNYNEWALLKPPGTPFMDYVNELPAAAAQTIIATITQSVLTGGMGRGVRGISQRFAGDAEKAAQDAGTLQEMMRLAAGTGLHKNDPQSIAAFVQAVADDTNGAPKSVFVDAVTLADTFQQAGMTLDDMGALLPSVLNQLSDATAMNSAVEIPVGEITSALAGHPLEKVLLPHLRAGENTLSQSEAVQQQSQATQFLQDSAERVIRQSVDAIQAAAGAETVRQTMATQLMATGRMTQDVANKGAALVRDFYTVMAAREGKTAEQLYAEHSYTVSGQAPAGRAGVLGQPAASFDNWLTSSPALSTAFTGDNAKVSAARDLWVNYQNGDASHADTLAAISTLTGVSTPNLVTGGLNATQTNDPGRRAWPTEPTGNPRFDGITGFRRSSADAYARADGAASAGVGSGDGEGLRLRLIDGREATPLATFTPSQELAEQLNAAGLATPVLHELDPAQQAGDFHASISNSLTATELSRKYAAAVHVYSPEEYAGMRLFLADGGKTGFALKGDDIVSVFNFEEGNKGAAGAMLEMAKQLGGRRLDAFDTALPSLYAAHGFEAVARTQWNDAFAPEGWNKETFAGYNNGEPDVVFMAYNDASARAYQEGDGETFTGADGYDNAVAAQQAAVEKAEAATTAATAAPLGNRYQQAFLAGREQGVLNQGEQDQYNALATPAAPGAPPMSLGTFDPVTLTTVLNANSNLSTFLHETGHAFVEIFSRMAANPTASEGIKADWSMLLKEMGTNAAEWDAWQTDFSTTGKISDGLRAFHEKFAESTELYLFTGKAPNRELQGLFRTFASWLTRVYKSVEQFQAEKGLTLSTELRGVMDRMLATEQQIADAEDAAGLLPNLDATAEATEQLRARSLRDLKWAVGARSKHIRALQADAKAARSVVEAEVTAEIEATPEMRAKAALDRLKVNPDHSAALKIWNAARDAELVRATAELNDALKAANPTVKGLAMAQLVSRNKRDIANQAEAQALAWEKTTPKPRRVVNFDDKDVQTIADSFGFESPETMLSAIDSFGSRAGAIEGMTDQRMLERHGDLASPEAIAQAANEAVHNEARAKSLATELTAQREMLNPRTETGAVNTKGQRVTVNALVEAAKTFATNVIGKRKLSDLKKAAWGHLQAERRAAKAWEAATAKGDTRAAVQAKQDQLLNNYAVKAANEAQAAVRKTLEYFATITRGNNEALVERGLDPDVVNAARAILGAYGLTTPSSKTAMEYLRTVEKQDPVMFGAIRDSIEGAAQAAKPLYDLTTDELAALNDEIRVLMHVARRSRQMEVDGNLMDIEDAGDELKARLEAIGVPATMPGDMGAITDAEKARGTLSFAGAILRRVEQWAEAKDGQFGGPFLRYVFQPVKEAADRYRADRVTYRKKFTTLVENLAPNLQPGEIKAPELNGYTFGKGKGGIGRAELTHAILHTGNQSNKRKLLLGRGWATENADGTMDTSKWDRFMTRMMDTGVINKAHYDFAQGVWDLLEETKPLAQKAHRDVFGRYFAEVTADAVDTPFGLYRGGYVPAQVDPGIVKDNEVRSMAEMENASMAYAFPTTSKGFTKGRVDYNRPLLLDLRTLSQHMDKVLLFAHMEPAVRDVSKLLTSKAVNYSLSRQDPSAMAGMLTPWLNRSARQLVETPIIGDGRVSRLLTVIRQRAGMALMIGNLSNTVQQIAGFPLAAIKVTPGDLKRATALYAVNPKQMSQMVSDASIFMKDRMDNEISALNESMEQILLNPSLYEKGQAWTQKNAYFMQQALDNVMGPIVWTGGYNQALREGHSVADAVRFADGVVRQTQGATQAEDVSRIETGPAYARLFSQFIGYFNMMANTNATALQNVRDDVGFRKGAGKALGIVFMGLLAPAWIAEAVAQAFRGGPDDEDQDGSYLDDWLMAVFGLGTFKTVMASVPFVGQFGTASFNTWNNKPYDDRTSFSPAISLLEATVGAPRSVYKAIVEDGSKQKAVRDVATLVSVATGLPAMLVARPVGYLTGIADNRIKPTSPADAARGLVTGVASPDSKR